MQNMYYKLVFYTKKLLNDLTHYIMISLIFTTNLQYCNFNTNREHITLQDTWTTKVRLISSRHAFIRLPCLQQSPQITHRLYKPTSSCGNYRDGEFSWLFDARTREMSTYRSTQTSGVPRIFRKGKLGRRSVNICICYTTYGYVERSSAPETKRQKMVAVSCSEEPIIRHIWNEVKSNSLLYLILNHVII